jgi:hypothetical protein
VCWQLGFGFCLAGLAKLARLTCSAFAALAVQQYTCVDVDILGLHLTDIFSMQIQRRVTCGRLVFLLHLDGCLATRFVTREKHANAFGTLL